MQWFGQLALALVLVAPSLSAQTNENTGTNRVRTISLEESIRLALEHNLNLQVERYSPQIARFNLAGSYAYYDPVVTLSGSESYRKSTGGLDPTTHLGTGGGKTWTEDVSAEIKGKLPTGMTYDLLNDVPRRSGSFYNGYEYRPALALTLDQPLLRNFWTDADRNALAVNKREVKIAQHAFEFLVIQTVNSVQQAYYDLIFRRENVKVQQKALELAQRSLDENKKRVQIGTLAPLDEKQSQSQAATAEADLIAAQNQLAAAENVLRSFITDKYSDWHGVQLVPTESLVTVPESFNLLDSWNKALTTRADYNQLKEELERQNLLLKFTYNQLFPSLDLRGSMGSSGLADNLGQSLEQVADREFPSWSAGAVFSMPLSRTLERNNYRRSKAEQKQALLRLKQLEQKIVIDIDDAVATARSDYKRIASTRQAREFAESALSAEQTKLENGKSTSFVVLELQNKLTQARSAEIQALTDYKKALTEFYFREGTLLERSKVIVK